MRFRCGIESLTACQLHTITFPGPFLKRITDFFQEIFINSVCQWSFAPIFFERGYDMNNDETTFENPVEPGVPGDADSAENLDSAASPAPKRKPVIRKVSAAPTKFAPKKNKTGDDTAAEPVRIFANDDEFSDEDDEAAYAAAREEERRSAARDCAPSRRKILPARPLWNPKCSSEIKMIP